jgi:BirA family biotin operon repressor/biotin-[acetyl-CoA-carboxylase] ligase
MAAAVSVARCLHSFLPVDTRAASEPSQSAAPGFGLKWPNDVLFADGDRERKICGILQKYIPSRPHGVIVGMGVNISNTISGDAAEGAVSLEDILEPFDMPVPEPIDVLERVHGEFMGLFDSFRSGEIETIVREWSGLSFTRGRKVSIQTVSGSMEGVAQGIREDGALEVAQKDGARQFITSGDCIHLRDDPGE